MRGKEARNSFSDDPLMKFVLLLVVAGLLMSIQALASPAPSVPEPISFILFGTGLAGLGAAAFIVEPGIR